MAEIRNYTQKFARFLKKERKGISPIIATILLIGVAVFAVGGIYSFTQSKLWWRTRSNIKTCWRRASSCQ
ncbi:MAG: archaellin/type IV pilin N-terminal domain-containing protein [Candidatus Nanohaloarchaea archaeon]